MGYIYIMNNATQTKEKTMNNQAIVHTNGIFTWATRSDNGFDTGEEIVEARRTVEDGDDLITELQARGFTVLKMSY
jgi:hypothetical protein